MKSFRESIQKNLKKYNQIRILPKMETASSLTRKKRKVYLLSLYQEVMVGRLGNKNLWVKQSSQIQD